MMSDEIKLPDACFKREAERQKVKNLEARQGDEDGFPPLDNRIPDRCYFDQMHNAAPRHEQIAEEDRINLERLKKSDTELFSYAHDYLFDDWDRLKPIIIMVLSGADDAEVGRLMRELKDAALPEYLSMVRKS